jgi:gluconolactonase
MAAAVGLATTTGMANEAFAHNFGPDAEPVRYPEPDVVVQAVTALLGGIF